MSETGITRRELLRRGGDVGGALALPLMLHSDSSSGAMRPAAPSSAGLGSGHDVYQSIGVRPLINARGTYTIISGSVMLPEVRAAMDAAAQQYVHLDELAEAIGARLAELTGAEWGMVTSGCAAALTHATAACVAGGNPDLHVRIPTSAGFPKDEVIIPKHSRNVYDAAVRAVGVRVIEVETMAELEAAFGPRTALVYILAGPDGGREPAQHAPRLRRWRRQRGVPVLVDAAAEILTVPNVHLQHGATLVGYSGGKCLRGPADRGPAARPQGAGAGRLGAQRAASRVRARHEGRQGRSDRHADGGRDVDDARPRGRVEPVAGVARSHRASASPAIDGVTTAIVQPDGLSNRTPALDPLGRRTARRHRRGRRAAAAGQRAAHRLSPRGATIASRDRHLDHAVHDGGRRREGRRRADLRRALESSARCGRRRRAAAGRRT